MHAMPLSQLLEVVPGAELRGEPGLKVSGVECDTRRLKRDMLFVAVRGNREDGHRYLQQAIAAGASAVLSAEPSNGRAAGLAWVRVPDEREALARLARRFHGEPDLRLSLVGVTGTKGKTTTAWLIESMVEAAGGRPGGIGTVRVRVGAESRPASLTTPDAPTVCALLARMVKEGCTHAVMEVSSQALDQRRVDGLRFRCAVFTNLAQDHLDYHGTMDAYLEAKARLFRALDPEAVAILPAGDPAAVRLAGMTRGCVVAYDGSAHSTGAPACAGPAPEVWIESSQLALEGTTAVLRTPQGRLEAHTPLVGRHNLHNLAAAAAAALALGLPASAVAAGAAAVQPVPGRMERVEEGQPFLVLVDYAHTEDALRRVLESLRELTGGRILCVFGCGGDRDPGKRAPMGAAAAALADVLFITSDNPRGEDPMLIIREIERGVQSVAPRRPYRLQPDRERAIAAALAEARPGDAVLIAGKGHEREQIIGAARRPFDDREQARQALRALASRGAAEAGR